MRLFIIMLSDSVKYNFRPVIIKKNHPKIVGYVKTKSKLTKCYNPTIYRNGLIDRDVALVEGIRVTLWYLLRIRPS